MAQTNMKPDWMNDELVKNIPQSKLEFLGKMYQESQGKTKGKSQKETMSFLLPLLKKAKEENMTFTPQEMTSCIAAIKKYSSEEELKQIDNILSKVK